ncbi:GNAT family N-acetyltransferase [Brevibacillus sp. SYSU BS000544]|uniref:GNAT family N-acetyltransferase n=1 Tax=Brevibacillus sp. SYSU BS000544 TaxID=3416443 RepID=UPI003CE48A94
MNLPILTNDLANQIEHADFLVMQDRMLAMQAKSGNPIGVEIKQFGNATALLAKNLPIRDFNRVYGFTPEDVPFLDEIKSFYLDQSSRIPFGIDVVPSACTSKMLEQLSLAGFRQTDFHTAMYGIPNSLVETYSPSQPTTSVTVHEVSPVELPVIEQIFIDALELPFNEPSELPENLAFLHNHPDWKLFLGYVNEQPAGFALFHLKENVASFAQAGTKPEFRGHGLQTALLQARMQAAIDTDAALLVAQASFGSISLRNLQRFGMQVAFTKSVWTYV